MTAEKRSFPKNCGRSTSVALKVSSQRSSCNFGYFRRIRPKFVSVESSVTSQKNLQLLNLHIRPASRLKNRNCELWAGKETLKKIQDLVGQCNCSWLQSSLAMAISWILFRFKCCFHDWTRGFSNIYVSFWQNCLLSLKLFLWLVRISYQKTRRKKFYGHFFLFLQFKMSTS